MVAWLIVLSIAIAVIAGLSAVAAKRQRLRGSPRDQWTAERAALDAQTRAAGRGGVGPGSGGP